MKENIEHNALGNQLRIVASPYGVHLYIGEYPVKAKSEASALKCFSKIISAVADLDEGK